MRDPSSSKQNNRRSIESPLTSDYIRSLVNQLSSSRPWEAANHPNSATAMYADHREGITKHQSQPPQQKPKKKQVKRLLHSSKPYQEKLLNMAEARKEIVAALKLHRAAMKQPSHTLQHKSTYNIYQPNSIVSSYNQPSPLFLPFTSASPPGVCTPINPLPIGLNLNLQSFINVASPIFGNSSKHVMHQPLLSHSPPSSSSSKFSSSSLHSAWFDIADDAIAASLHPSDAEIRTIGKKHEVEWNDTINLMSTTSSCWSKFMRKVIDENLREGEAVEAFGEALNLPSWQSDYESGKNGNGNYLSLELSLDEFLQDVPLPWDSSLKGNLIGNCDCCI